MDCLEGMKQIPDNSVDLILTDPPYVHGVSCISSTQIEKYKQDWNKNLNLDVFKEIFRISKNQIIFGAEHLCHNFPKSRGWIVWDKRLKSSESNDFADCELIWTSFNKPARIIRYLWNGFRVELKEKRFAHPTQKPLKLIINLINQFSKENDLILDPFMGSGTTAVACKQLNSNFIGFELSQEYVDIANKRLAQENLKGWFDNGKD